MEKGTEMIRAICYYTNQKEDEPSSLREQQHQCLEAIHDYGWVIHREVFDPFMKKVKIAQRSGMRTLLHEAAAHKFDLLVMMDKHFIGTCKEEAAVILILCNQIYRTPIIWSLFQKSLINFISMKIKFHVMIKFLNY